MARSPEYVVPVEREGQSLAGISPCGCVTAAQSMTRHPGFPGPTEKQVRDFYASMGKTGREVRWLPTEEIRKRLFECEHETAA